MKTKFNVIIIDDLEQGIALLRYSLSHLPKIQIVGTATSAETGESLVMELQPDLLFLDVEMPRTTGFELLQSLRNKITWSMQVVIYSSYQKYAIDAIREFVFDFLQKPYQHNDFLLVMERFFAFKAKTNENYIDLQKSKNNDLKVMIGTPTGLQIVTLSQIGYFEYLSERKQWNAILPNKKRLTLKSNTNAQTILAYSSSLVKINQNQIININYLSEIQENKCTLSHPFDNEPSLTVSRNSMKLLQKEFIQI
jgi:two-component system, LytTR family, response regulator